MIGQLLLVFRCSLSVPSQPRPSMSGLSASCCDSAQAPTAFRPLTQHSLSVSARKLGLGITVKVTAEENAPTLHVIACSGTAPVVKFDNACLKESDLPSGPHPPWPPEDPWLAVVLHCAWRLWEAEAQIAVQDHFVELQDN